MVNLTIANEIRKQLGSKALFMFRAKNFVGDDKSLTFRILGCKKYSYINIALNGMDLYDITFYKIVKFEIKNKKVVSDVYVEDLHKTIETNS